MRTRRPSIAVTVIVGGVFAGAGACGQSRSADPFIAPLDASFADASFVDGPADCLLECSLDGRSVVRACTGEIVETCHVDAACGAGRCQDPCSAAAADQSSNGCEFYFQAPDFASSDGTSSTGGGHSCYAAYVVNASTVPVDLSLSLQGKPLDISKAMYRTNYGDGALIPHTGPIQVGDSIVLFVSDRDPKDPGSGNTIVCPKGVVPATYINPLPKSTGIGSSFHLTSNVPISLAAIYPYGGAASYYSSATLLLPVATWGTRHIIVNAWEAITAFGGNNGGPGAQIVASEDNTDVTVLPNHDIQDAPGMRGGIANVPITYHLNKGQLVQFDQAEELSGSFVSSNKPTSVFGGHECMFLPSDRWACDTALQELPSVDHWGSEYVAVGYRPRLGDESELMPYRIVAARDGTRLDYDPYVPPGAPITMSAGQVVTFWSGVGNAFVVRTQDVDHPIYLAAYMSGGGTPNAVDILGPFDFRGIGDPEFVNVVPAGQYLNAYSFFADPTYRETSLVIVRAKSRGQFSDVWMECSGTLSGFKPVGTKGNYEYLRVDLSNRGGPGQAFDAGVCKYGLQRMKSDGPFTATVWGWSPYVSYAYPGGMAQRKLVKEAFPPVR